MAGETAFMHDNAVMQNAIKNQEIPGTKILELSQKMEYTA